jgi:hypothetical protein
MAPFSVLLSDEQPPRRRAAARRTSGVEERTDDIEKVERYVAEDTR